MPFINAIVSAAISQEQEKQLKERLAQAITAIPGKSEQWLMIGFQDNYHLYFRGDNSQPSAFIEVQIYGNSNPPAFDKLTGEITRIFNDILKITSDHIYIKYSPTSDWGWNGSNF